MRAVPAGNKPQGVAIEERFQRLGIAREFAAHFDPGKSGLARLGEAGLERDVATELGHVVVRPRDRIDTEPDGHGRSVSKPTAMSSRFSCSGERKWMP